VSQSGIHEEEMSGPNRVERQRGISRGVQHGVISLGGRILQTSPDILLFQVGKVLKDLRLGGARPEHFEHIFDPNPHSPDTRPARALFGIKGDAFEVVHRGTVCRLEWWLKLSLPPPSSAPALKEKSCV
jgi:hypothetical protein